jgi:NADH:ubiquinone oxidoreductase subunit 3 (subunit A)
MATLEYGPVAVYMVVGIAFAAISLIAAYVIRPADPYDLKNSTYECGIPPFGQAWSQFYVRYYIVALIFVVFDVETVFLFPWAVVYKHLAKATALGPARLGPAALVEMAIFLLVLIIGLAYAWRKGDLEWTSS